MDEDDTETLERKLREKALQSMQRHAKSPEGQEENDDDWFAEKLTKGKNSKVETDRPTDYLWEKHLAITQAFNISIFLLK